MSDAATPSAAPSNARYNFVMLVGDVSCFVIGAAFLDSASALPALVGRLGGGALLLGALGAIRQGAYFLPQLFVAHRLQNVPRYKPFLLLVAGVGRVGYFPLALCIMLFGASHPALCLALLVVQYSVAWLGDGAGGVPWTSIVGRAIPARRRGGLFAATQTISGVMKLGVSAVIVLLLSGKVTLGGKPLLFPAADGALVLACAMMMAVSWVFLAAIREPAGEPTKEDAPAAPLLTYLRSLPARLRERPDFAKLALVQILASASVSTAPFLWRFVHAAGKPIAAGDAGRFLAAQTVGLLVFAPIWGAVSDRAGPRRTLTAIFAVALCSPLLAFAGRAAGGGVWLFYGAYFLLGGVVENWIMITNYLLESVPENDQATYIGLMNAVSLPALLLPLLAGALAATLGEGVALLFALLLLAAGLFVARSLPDTRRRV